MSTPTITPSDPQAMPLADLKNAAGLGTPEPAAPPAVAAPTPAPPIVPEKFTVSQGDDGVVITLAPEYGGEVFKGKDFNEAALKLAGSKADTNAYVKQLKSQPATPTPVVAPATPPPVDPAVQATRDWLLAENAAALGMTPDEYKARVGMVFKTTEQMATNIAIADFHQMCPGYTDTQENSNALQSYFPEDLNRFPTAQELKQAYALAVLDGKITPASTQPPPVAARPPVMPSAGASSAGGDQSAWTMPLDQLKTQAGLG